MVNSNLYDDQPYLPSRDPREVNIVERLKDIRETEPVYVNDEDVQHSDLEKEVTIIVERVIEDRNPESSGGSSSGGNSNPDGGDSGETIYRSAIISAATLSDFPSVGSEDLLYLATEENDGNGYLYRWCPEQDCYLRPEDSTDDISLIEGGNAFSGTL